MSDVKTCITVLTQICAPRVVQARCAPAVQRLLLRGWQRCGLQIADCRSLLSCKSGLPISRLRIAFCRVFFPGGSADPPD
eukprot:3032464-Alexandrium_andersonii.AAC.1